MVTDMKQKAKENGVDNHTDQILAEHDDYTDNPTEIRIIWDADNFCYTIDGADDFGGVTRLVWDGYTDKDGKWCEWNDPEDAKFFAKKFAKLVGAPKNIPINVYGPPV